MHWKDWNKRSHNLQSWIDGKRNFNKACQFKGDNFFEHESMPTDKNRRDCSEVIVVYRKAICDDLRFVKWCVILLDMTRWAHCGHKGMDIIGKDTQPSIRRLNNEELVEKGLWWAKKNFSHTVIQLPPVWAVAKRQDGFVFFMSFDCTVWILQLKLGDISSRNFLKSVLNNCNHCHASIM